MDFMDWLPIIVSGIFVAFGAALWAWVRKVIKSFGDTIEKGFLNLDPHLEKWMGVSNSNEVWRTIADFGKEITSKAEKMIEVNSFQPSGDIAGGNTENLTDLSSHLNQ